MPENKNEKLIHFEEVPGRFTLINRFPDKITHRFGNALFTGFLFGIGLCLGLFLTLLVLLGVVGVLALLLSP